MDVFLYRVIHQRFDLVRSGFFFCPSEMSHYVTLYFESQSKLGKSGDRVLGKRKNPFGRWVRQSHKHERLTLSEISRQFQKSVQIVEEPEKPLATRWRMDQMRCQSCGKLIVKEFCYFLFIFRIVYSFFSVNKLLLIL